MSRHLQRLIHAGCRELGIDTDTRHDLQRTATGKASLSDMTEAELRLVVDALRAKGFKPASKGRERPAAKRADVRLCHVLWRLLAEHGAVRTPGRAGLNAFLRSQFGHKWGHVPIDIDAMQDAARIDDVVQALKAWCRREGIAVRRHG